MVETGRLGLEAVLLVAITRHGDQYGLIHVKLRPQAAGDAPLQKTAGKPQKIDLLRRDSDE
jgi:hypothetical protein